MPMTPERAAEIADLVAEARMEAIKDGDPETCLTWALADAIVELAVAYDGLAKMLAVAAAVYGGSVVTDRDDLRKETL